jgi:type IV pilus assembly protein PilV
MLIEALIAILIFSVGVLAIVQLQAIAAKQAADAEYRSMASMLASDLVSRMWGTDRTSATLKTAYGSEAGQGYKEWFDQVKASRLPGVTDEDNKPEIDIGTAKGLTATQVKITLHWQAPGKRQNTTGKDERLHEYVTVVVLR